MSEKKHHVFISYSTIDTETAFSLLHVLEANGLKCWIAPRDIPQGAQWANEIDQAIQSSRVFVVIVSSNSIKSKQVPKEIALAITECEGIFPFRIDNSALQGGFRYYLSDYQFVDAVHQTEAKMQELANSIRYTLKLGPLAPQQEDTAKAPAGNSPAPVGDQNPIKKDPASKSEAKEPAGKQPRSPKKRLPLILAIVGLLIVCAVLAIALSGVGKDAPPASVSATTEPGTGPGETASSDSDVQSGDAHPWNAEELSPLFGAWELVATEHHGGGTPKMGLGDYTTDSFTVCADGTVYESYTKYLQTADTDRRRLLWSGNSVNFTEVFSPVSDPDSYSITSTCFFLDSFSGTAPENEGNTNAPVYEPLDVDSLDPDKLTYSDCYPDRYLVVHITGTFREIPTSNLDVDSWLVFQRQYPLLQYSQMPTMVGEWVDNMGNTWKFWPSKDEIAFNLTTEDGTVYDGKYFADYDGKPDQADFYERLSISFDDFTMPNNAVVYYDGATLYLLDQHNKPLILTRK